MIATLDEAWEWYVSAKNMLQVTNRLARSTGMLSTGRANSGRTIISGIWRPSTSPRSLSVPGMNLTTFAFS